MYKFGIYIMMSRTQQQLKRISQNPNQINSLNLIIKQILLSKEGPTLQIKALKSVLQLIQLFISNTSQVHQSSLLRKFLDQKIFVICYHLLEKILHSSAEEEENNEAYHMFITAFHLCSDKQDICRHVIENTIKNQLTNESINAFWNMLNDVELISSLSQFIANNLHLYIDVELHKVYHFIVELPHFQLIQQNCSENIKKMKRNYEQLVLAFLNSPTITRELSILFYRKIGEQVLSKFFNPLILSQYFVEKFKDDCEIQVEILSCLFILVGKYGLELQEFYPKLEELIKKKKNGLSIYELPNSRRFFKLVESALRSSKVPFKVIFSMVKIILEQVFLEESQFSYWALSFLVNLTKKHRKLVDYLKDIPQIELLKHHYSSKIRKLVGELSTNLNKAQYLDIQQFSKVNCLKLTQLKVTEVLSKLQQDSRAEFKVISIYEPI